MTRFASLPLASLLIGMAACIGPTGAAAQQAQPGLSANTGQNRPVLNQNVKDRLCALSDPTGRRCRSSQTAPSQPSTSQQRGSQASQRQQPSSPADRGSVRPGRRG